MLSVFGMFLLKLDKLHDQTNDKHNKMFSNDDTLNNTKYVILSLSIGLGFNIAG